MNILPFAVALTAPPQNQVPILEALIPTMLPINPDQRALFTAFSANEQATRVQVNRDQAVRTASREILEAVIVAAQREEDGFRLSDDDLGEFPNVDRLDLADDIAELLAAIRALWFGAPNHELAEAPAGAEG